MATKRATRARKLTEEESAQVEALAAYLSVEQMADFFGISYSTMRRILERDADVLSRYKKGRSKALAAVAQGLLQQARGGNMTAAIFYLKTRGGWSTSHELTVSGSPDGSPEETPAITITLGGKRLEEDDD